MAKEASVSASLRINKGNLQYQSQPQSFNCDVSGLKGPTPGAIDVPLGGVAVDLSALTTPGFYRILNLDSTNYVELGIRDPGADIFYPLHEVGPGETYVGKFSRNILEEYAGTGTGTTAPGNQVWLKANGAACIVVVEAFEK